MGAFWWHGQNLDSSAAAAARLNNLPADQRATVTMFGSLLFADFFLVSKDSAATGWTLAAT